VLGSCPSDCPHLPHLCEAFSIRFAYIMWILDAECGTSDTKSVHCPFAGTVSMTMGVIFPSGGDGHCAQL
jgi:hypothetical protein